MPQPLAAFSSSELPVSFRVDHGPAVIADGTIKATQIGAIRGTAEQAGNADFLPVSITRSFNQTEIQGSVVTNLEVALAQPEKAPESLLLPFNIQSADIRLLGDRVYLASSTTGLWAVDLGDRGQPILFPQSLLTTSVQSVDAVPGYVFGGSQAGPVTVVKTREGLSQDVLSSIPSLVWVTNGPVTLDLSITGSTGTSATFHLLEGPATLSGHQLTITNAGFIYGEWILPGNEQFLEARGIWNIVAQKLSQSIVFRPPPVVGLARGPFLLQASSSSELPVTFELVSGPATLEGQRLTPDAVGTVVIRATQPGSLAYLPAEPVLGTIQVLELPEIVHQPTPTNVPSGSPVALGVTATGNGAPSFQWYKNGAFLPNETLPVLSRSAAGPADPGLYHVVVRLDSGGAVTSSVVSLTVDLPGSEIRLRPRGSLPHRTAPSSSNPGRIEVQGDYAYVVNQGLSSLQVFDIRNPDSPILANTIRFQSSLHQDLAFKDGYLLLAEREQGIGILDLGNPAKPVRLASYRFPGNRADVVTVQVVGNRAFVGNGSYGFAVLDVENPREPSLISSFDATGLAAGIWLHDNQAYLADWDSGLKVLDLANLAAPRLLGRYPERDSPFNYYDLVGRPGWVYLIHQDIGILTFDISRPSAPAVTQTNRGSIFGLDLAGGTLFAADNAAQSPTLRTPGIRLFDLSSPESPLEYGRFAEWGRVDGTRLDGNRLFVTGDRFGIIDLEFPQRPPVFVTEPRSQILRFGEPGRLECSVQGADPLSYQWWYRDAPLLNATNRSLALGPVTEENAGLYTVEVRNPWGTVRSAPARMGFEQLIRWESLPTNSVLRIQRPHDLPATTDLGFPITYRILSGPATVTQGQLWITNVGSVRLLAEQIGSDTAFPTSREWVLNVGTVQFLERGHWPEFHPGTAAAVDLEGYLAIVAIRDGGLLALNVTNPAQPRWLGEFWNGGEWTDVRFADGLAYAMNNQSGLTIVDFHDPSHPVLRSTFGPLLPEGRLELANRVAYLHGASHPLQLVDVSDPAIPVLLSAPPAFQDFDHLVVRGDRAFATGGAGWVEMIDVRDPKNLVMLSSFGDTRPGYSLDVQGELVAVGSPDGGLNLFSVTAGNSLEPLGVAGLPGPSTQVAWRGQHLWVASGANGLVQVDATQPIQPVFVAAPETEYLTRSQSVRIHGDHAYVTDYFRGLVIYEIRPGNVPKEIGWFPTSGVAGAVRVEGNRAYVQGQPGGLAILDVADPDHPNRLGGVPSRNKVLFPTVDSLTVYGRRAFYPDGSAGVQIIDVENPTTPTRLGAVDIVDVTEIQAASETELHVAHPTAGARLYDVSEASNPELVSHSFLGLTKVHVTGRQRISAGNRIVWVEELSTPASPVLLGNVSLSSGNITSMDVSGDRVFLGSNSGLLSVVDVSHPRYPVTLTQVSRRGPYQALDVEGDYVVIAQGESGLEAYHAFLPEGLKFAGSKGGFSNSKDLQVVEDLVYVADSRGGLRILELRSGIPQTIPNFPPASPLAGGSSLELSTTSDAGLPIRYTVVEGNAVIEGGTLQLAGEGQIKLRAEIEGDRQFVPATVEHTFQVRIPPTLRLESVEAGLRIQWKGNSGSDLLQFSDSLSGTWQVAEVLSSEYLTDEATFVATVPAPTATRYYRVRLQ